MAYRVSPPRITPAPTGAPKPTASAPESDAHRQTGFVLGHEVQLVLDGLAIEGAIAEASAGAKFRSQAAMAVMGPWSRSWLARLAALHAAQFGNYAAAIPLVRAAADYQAAAWALQTGDGPEWTAWLDGTPIALTPDVHATEFRLHAFRSAETLANDPVLGPVYRVATDLAMPNFGATVLLVASDSAPDRILMTFGDRSFHVALAELVLGWLLALGGAQVTAVGSEGTPFAAAPDPGAVSAFQAGVAGVLADSGRCRVEAIEHGGESRYLVYNWRRTPGSAAKKLLL